MLRVGRRESLSRLMSALQLKTFSSEATAHQLTSKDSEIFLDENMTGGIKTIGGLPLPRYVPTQRKECPAPVALTEAIRQLKSNKRAKFDEAIDIAINLGIDPRRGDQMVRGAVSLPHGTGKSVRVCVFAKDEVADAARAAGADVIGSDDLIAEIQQSGGSGLKFDKCIATPDMMSRLGKIARILGPRGLMPNPKLGTVTTNVVEAIASLKKGRVEFRADKGAVIHAAVGRCSFEEDHVYTNIGTLVAALLSAKPKGVKGGGLGGYLIKASLSSTMGPGIPVTVPSLVQAAQIVKHGPGAV